LDRQLIELDHTDNDADGSGRPRKFGSKSIYRIALLHRLARVGLNPKSAAALAATFCDRGQPGRLPGALFPQGRTLLIATADGAGKVINLPPDSFVDDIVAHEVSIIVDVGRILEGVNARLGLPVSTERNLDSIISEFSNSNLRTKNVQ
jgi:hypothetical protein